MYAEVILTRPTHRRPAAGNDPLRDDGSQPQAFTYRLPDRLRDSVGVGHLVQVPLGGGMALGVVASVSPEPPRTAPPELREVAELLDPLPVATQTQIDLARWLAAEYLAPLSEAMRLMLPPGLEERTSLVVSQRAPRDSEPLTQPELEALRLISAQGGTIPLSALLGRLRSEDAGALVDSLVEKGLVEAKFALIPPRPAPPRVRYIAPLADDRSIQTAIAYLGRSSAQADLLLVLANRADTPLSLPELCEAVGCTPAPVHALADRGWVTVTRARTLLVAAQGPGPKAAEGLTRAPRQAAALAELVARGGVDELEAFTRSTGASPAVLRELERRNLILRVAEPALVVLTLPREQVLDKVVELRSAVRDRAVLEALRGTTGRVWVGGIYAQTGADLATLHRLAFRGLISLHAELADRRGAAAPKERPPLAPGEEGAWREIAEGLASPLAGGPSFSALLQSAADSGTAEISRRAMEQTLASGRRVVVLGGELGPVLEISRSLEEQFPGQVAVVHGHLSLGQRYQAWDRVRRGEAGLLVGPRSALFAPIPRLGLILIHDAHDEVYKQQEPIPQPAYHACDVADELGRMTGAAVLYVSATPDVVMVHRAGQGALRRFEITRRPPASGLPSVQAVDLRQELRAGNRGIFSRTLQRALSETLGAGKQAILFLNRRGSATFVLCRDCGYVARCPRCDTLLTFHATQRVAASAANPLKDREPQVGGVTGLEGLVCHRCDYRQPLPSSCPQCGGMQIRYFGLGTERVETEMRALFPEARVLRCDRDLSDGTSLAQEIQRFVGREADVLVGTEMIAGAPDPPSAALVGIISADTALNLPDFRAAERAFQLLSRVAGLAGDGGRVIMQTYHPDHYAIRAVAAHDYEEFYRNELVFRLRIGYPPYSRLLALRYQDADRRACQAEAEHLGAWLQAEIRRLNWKADLIGPAPCFYTRYLGRYRWQIVIRAEEPAALLRHVALPRGWRIDVDPVTLL